MKKRKKQVKRNNMKIVDLTFIKRGPWGPSQYKDPITNNDYDYCAHYFNGTNDRGEKMRYICNVRNRNSLFTQLKSGDVITDYKMDTDRDNVIHYDSSLRVISKAPKQYSIDIEC